MGTHSSYGSSPVHIMKCMIVVLAVASLCLAEPEADPLHYYAPYGYASLYRPYYASGYAGPLPGASYQSVHRLHKREAEADPQLLLNAGLHFPAAAPLVAPASAPVVAAAPLVAPAPITLPVAHAVAHAPVVKSVVETPAVVSHEVHSVPVVHHVAPLVHHVAPVAHAAPPVHHAAPLVHHAAPLVHHVAPVVETVSKPVTYTHLGAHPIQPTTVIQTESKLVGR